MRTGRNQSIPMTANTYEAMDVIARDGPQSGTLLEAVDAIKVLMPKGDDERVARALSAG